MNHKEVQPDESRQQPPVTPGPADQVRRFYCPGGVSYETRKAIGFDKFEEVEQGVWEQKSPSTNNC